MQQNIEQLQAELADLKDATRLILAASVSALACNKTSSAAAKALIESIQRAERQKPRSDAFWDLASTVLLALSSSALAQHPDDQELMAIHQELRRSTPSH